MRSLTILLLALAVILPAAVLDADAGSSTAKDRALVLQLKKQRLTKIAFKETNHFLAANPWKLRHSLVLPGPNPVNGWPVN